jgi:hypothetical protein
MDYGTIICPNQPFFLPEWIYPLLPDDFLFHGSHLGCFSIYPIALGQDSSRLFFYLSRDRFKSEMGIGKTNQLLFQRKSFLLIPKPKIKAKNKMLCILSTPVQKSQPAILHKVKQAWYYFVYL